MARPVITLSGSVVALTTNPYDFIDSGGKQVRGTTRKLWLATKLTEEPTDVRVRDEDWPDVAALAQFDVIDVTCELSANGREIRHHLVAFDRALADLDA